MWLGGMWVLQPISSCHGCRKQKEACRNQQERCSRSLSQEAPSLHPKILKAFTSQPELHRTLEGGLSSSHWGQAFILSISTSITGTSKRKGNGFRRRVRGARSDVYGKRSCSRGSGGASYGPESGAAVSRARPASRRAPASAMAKDILSDAGLHFDELNKLRVLDPEVTQQTIELKEECKDFVDTDPRATVCSLPQETSDGLEQMVATPAGRAQQKERTRKLKGSLKTSVPGHSTLRRLPRQTALCRALMGRK
uniref:Intraflagellar transport protein 20 homolog isoform X1 n=1 Tax=Phascolarctos cinereus TaxID=38626 RepID=A0A6P5IJK1_PHACI|nr:intraflagellar transport protein 20 homolog isoform X1 [Phascolarctos cinereus]